MGVTKKKAYLKPEITKFEMKMEAPFLAGSKEIIEIPDVDQDGETIDFTTALGSECTRGGTYMQIAAGGCQTFRMNNLDKGDCSIWPILIKKWPDLTEGSQVCICHKIIDGESRYYASKGTCTSSTIN